MPTMADQASRFATIAASPETCLAVALDFPSYPEWARDVKHAEIKAVDDDGRGVEVEFRAAAIGRSAHYTLAYDYSGLPERMRWWLVSGDLMSRCDGAYQFTPSTTLPGGTDVVYDLEIDVVMPLPGFVKRRAEVRILNTLNELRHRCEAVTRREAEV